MRTLNIETCIFVHPRVCAKQYATTPLLFTTGSVVHSTVASDQRSPQLFACGDWQCILDRGESGGRDSENPNDSPPRNGMGTQSRFPGVLSLQVIWSDIWADITKLLEAPRDALSAGHMGRQSCSRLLGMLSLQVILGGHNEASRGSSGCFLSAGHMGGQSFLRLLINSSHWGFTFSFHIHIHYLIIQMKMKMKNRQAKQMWPIETKFIEFG